MLQGSGVVGVLAEGGGPCLDAPVLDVAVLDEPGFPTGLVHRNGDVESPG